MAASIIKTTAAITLQRQVGGFTADTTIEEHHDDTLVTTDHPVEQGSTITDNAYKLPAMVTVSIGYGAASNQNTGKDPGFLNAIYAAMLQVQSNRTLFTVVTKRRVYQNMLLQNISLTTDKYTENAILVRLTCKEIIFVSTRTITVSNNAATQTVPQRTLPTTAQATKQLLTAPTANITPGELNMYLPPSRQLPTFGPVVTP